MALSTDLLHGTLDQLILQTLVPGRMQGWGVAQRINEVSDRLACILADEISPSAVRTFHLLISPDIC
jgi:hypothetical protein